MYKRKGGESNKPRPYALSIDEIADLGKNIVDFEGRSLFYCSYLLASRISEALAIKREDFIEEVPGAVLSINLKNLKNQKSPTKNLPIFIKGMTVGENYMASFFWDWLKNKPEGLIFPKFTPWDAWFLFKKIEVDKLKAQFENKVVVLSPFHVHPHYLRHCRLSHLSNVYHMNELEITHFAGWTSAQMAGTYVHSDWKGLADSFLSRQNQWASFAERLAKERTPLIQPEADK